MGPDIEEPCPKSSPERYNRSNASYQRRPRSDFDGIENFTAADYHARHHRGYLGTKSRQPHNYDSEGQRSQT